MSKSNAHKHRSFLAYACARFGANPKQYMRWSPKALRNNRLPHNISFFKSFFYLCLPKFLRYAQNEDQFERQEAF